MSEENKIQKNNNNAVIRQSISFSGPLPHPQLLEKYNEVVPGSAKMIIEMAEKQAIHRQELEKNVINSDIKNSKSGLIFGFIIGISGILGGIIIIAVSQATSQIIAGSVISGASLASLVGTFVYGSQGRKKEREEKKKND